MGRNGPRLMNEGVGEGLENDSPKVYKTYAEHPKVSYSLLKATQSVLSTPRSRDVYFEAQKPTLLNPNGDRAPAIHGIAFCLLSKILLLALLLLRPLPRSSITPESPSFEPYKPFKFERKKVVCVRRFR